MCVSRAFVEAHALRDTGRARLTLRVLSLGDLMPDQLPYRVRITMPANDASEVKLGETVTLSATLQLPPEPIAPGSFYFARQAWFDRLGATGYATSKALPRGRRAGAPVGFGALVESRCVEGGRQRAYQSRFTG